MSSGIFGSIKPADINPSTDVEILYMYRPSRGEDDDDFKGFKELSATDCLTNAITNDEDTILGLYNLKLPLDSFNKKGFYSVYIKPKAYTVKIVDVSVLAAYPDVRGIVLNINDFSGETDLTGYRIEFSDDAKTVRMIKSCNRCEPVIVNTNDGYPKTTRYNLTDNSSNYVFCTVSPSSTASFKTNTAPYIGEPDVEIQVVNTKFSPKLIEIEMVNHDADTISYMLEGDQTNDKDNAIITTYNDNHEIYHQSDYYVLKDKLGNPLYTVKKQRETIDNTQNYDNIID